MSEEESAPALPNTSEEEARTEEDSGTKANTKDEEEGKTEEDSGTKTTAEEEATAEEVSGNKATETGSGACGCICALPIAIAAIVIAHDSLDDLRPACHEDAIWLLVFGINVIVYGVLGLMAGLATGKPAFVYIKAFAGLFGMYKFGWSIYGVVLFTKEKSKECDVHLHTFGYVMAIITMILVAILAVFICCCMCCSGAFLGAAMAADTDEEAQDNSAAADDKKEISESSELLTGRLT